ncbi:hypothetical protein BBO99_00001952 [Phytophthora kernoviae]|uniref:PDZ domain-containing protein n=2 Tax=Phytophthora kernoviae TaxID=325452 RepID=A0A3R7K536_9STRA|nr:hypothetical protein G195_002501 [Phytophthora kernoviae 00238/432]KAG2530190.1 hypothetical protein JM16_001633 [Phytophthora kernoviae]KAG2530276.1 hypothetical protein JM18_001803 [Phytophthora kernoviae]RLN20257.1 hypothetical protein BBI17_001998 [Phytophthora kernoviae]RLN83595.1 hypothetical protein BBO99_00001952 [Phytophthora kernoviae]
MEKREVVFTEEKLGLTLKSEDQVDPMGYRIPVTIVKSTIFSVGQVSHQIREGDVLQSVNGESITNLEFSDAAILVSWRAHPKALAYHLQFSRDWTMKVWKNWSGRPRPSGDDEHELMTTIFGLDHAKTYVVRVRYEFGSAYTPGEWSSPSAPITTVR